ncbi:MAG: hypothetical protein WDM81_09915 [Rhizomicrobium sp.]
MTRALLALHAATRFRLTPARRIASENDPEGSAAPLLFMSGCEEGWIGYVREDMDDAAARGVRRIDLARAAGPRARCGPPLRRRLSRDRGLGASCLTGLQLRADPPPAARPALDGRGDAGPQRHAGGARRCGRGSNATACRKA